MRDPRARELALAARRIDEMAADVEAGREVTWARRQQILDVWFRVWGPKDDQAPETD